MKILSVLSCILGGSLIILLISDMATLERRSGEEELAIKYQDRRYYNFKIKYKHIRSWCRVSTYIEFEGDPKILEIADFVWKNKSILFVNNKYRENKYRKDKYFWNNGYFEVHVDGEHQCLTNF